MKITIIGAGSYVFTRNLLTDFLTFPALQEADIWLEDIEPERLTVMAALAERMVSQQKCGVSIHTTTDLRAALDGADYVFSTVRVGDTRSNLEIPARYGVSVSVADTTGAGAAFYFLRNAPVILQVARTMQEVCPNGLLLNYTNPMGMLCWAVSLQSKIRSVGLCHSVQGTAMTLASYIGAPFEEISFWVAGLNHMAWFLEFLWRGEDAYPLLWRAMQDPDLYARDRVRWDLMRYFGAFVSESSTHSSEYHPYFRRTPALIERYLGLEIGGPGQPSYLDHLRSSQARGAERRQAREAENRQLAYGSEPIPIVRGREYGSCILNAIETNTPFLFNGNVANDGLITNLLPGAIVEVPIMVDGTGLHPLHVGALPPALAALNRTALNCQELAVRGLLEGQREYIYQAAQLDPLVAALLPLDQIRAMVDELFASDAEYITI
jgi:alpha-galactosidase